MFPLSWHGERAYSKSKAPTEIGNQTIYTNVHIISGIRHLQKIADTSALKSIGTKPLGRHHPGCREHTYNTDDYWICYIRHNSMTVYHPTSTCKMGSAADPTSVVDSKLRYITVFGESIHANCPAILDIHESCWQCYTLKKS